MVYQIVNSVLIIFPSWHVLFTFLESVGSKNLLSPTDGYADKEITPNIASLQEHGITFQNVYDTFPSTTRAHIPLETGGITPTMGSIEINSFTCIFIFYQPWW